MPQNIPDSSKLSSFGRRSDEHFLVLGAGIAGLTTSLELLKRGYKVTLIEKADLVGGLARTFQKDGYRFDIGGHRFHSNNPSVVNWLKDLLRQDLLVVPRVSRIFLNNKFVDYPIQFPNALSIFSPLQAAAMVRSYVEWRFFKGKSPDVSFEDWVVKRFGKAMYEVFFKPYTEKVWGIPASQLAASWASKRIGIPSLARTVKHALIPPKEQPATAISQFYYPREGFGMIPEKLRENILMHGGTILLGADITAVKPDDYGFTIELKEKQGERRIIKGERLVSTIPLNALLSALPPEYEAQEIIDGYELEYRDLMCLFVAIDNTQVSPDSWTYFPDKELSFGRTHEPKNWSPEMVPREDVTSLCVEIFSSRQDDLWKSSDKTIAKKVLDEMNDLDWVRKSDVSNWWLLRVPNAYPVYRCGYEANIRAVRDYLNQWNNLYLVGRTGSFVYMNSDGVIEDVFEFIKTLETESSERSQEQVTALPKEAGRWV